MSVELLGVALVLGLAAGLEDALSAKVAVLELMLLGVVLVLGPAAELEDAFPADVNGLLTVVLVFGDTWPFCCCTELTTELLEDVVELELWGAVCFFGFILGLLLAARLVPCPSFGGVV